MTSLRNLDAGTRRLAVVAGMASYLDAGALVASGLAVGGFYARGMGLAPFTVGVLLGLQTLGFATGALVGGRLGDRLGRRGVLIGSLVAYVIGVAMLAAAIDAVSLGVGLALSGLAIGADLPTSLAMIGEEAPAGAKGRLITLSQLLWIAGIGTVGLLGLVVSDLGVVGGRILYGFLLAVAIAVLAMRLQLRESREWIVASAQALQQDSGAAPPVSGPTYRIPRSVWPAAAALGLYYTLWNLGANTLGQFRPYLWIEVMGGDPSGVSVLILSVVPLGLIGTYLYMLVVDTSSQQRWFVAAGLLSVLGWVLVSLRPDQRSFVVLCVLFSLGASASGEVAYKVWIQQLVPTLCRARVQGATLALARAVAAAIAIVTPVVATRDPRLLFGALALANAGSLLVAVTWIRRMGDTSADPLA